MSKRRRCVGIAALMFSVAVANAAYAQKLCFSTEVGPTHKLAQDIEPVCRFAFGAGSRSASIGTLPCGNFARFINPIE
jgi:hypothetical protein